MPPLPTGPASGDEFKIDVTFSNVEQAVLGEIKGDVGKVADAIALVASTMDEQIKAMRDITKELRDINSSGQSGGVGQPVGSTSPVSHIAGSTQNQGMDSVVRELQNLGSRIERSSGGGLFGKRGLTSGYRQWDEENSFEMPQFPGAQFTLQDALRQGGAMLGGYKDRLTGAPVDNQTLEDLHEQRQNNPNQNIWREQDYIKQATAAQNKWYQKPFASAWGHIEGTEDYIASLGTGYEGHPLASKLAKASVALPYFSKGGVLNPGTYGLGLNDMRRHAAQIGSTYGRWGAQFGGDTTFNPLDDSSQEYFGAQWQGARNSWFGLNPFLSSGQAAEITGAVAGSGYSGGTAEDMRQTLSNVTQHTNIPISDQMSIMDRSFRWGYASLQELTEFMKTEMPAATNAARMNMAQYSGQLVQVAQQMSQTAGSRGVNFYTAASQVNDLVQGTGIDPGTAGQLYGSSVISWMAAAAEARDTGQPLSYGRTVNSPERAKYTAEAQRTQITRMLGNTTPEEIQRLLKSSDPQDIAKVNALQTRLALGTPIAGVNSLQDTQRFTMDAIHRTQAATDANSTITAIQSHRDEAKQAYIDQHGGSKGSHSAWDISQGSGWNPWADHESEADKAGDKGVANYIGKDGLKKTIEYVKKVANQQGWSSDELKKVLGTHDVTSGNDYFHPKTTKALGDPNKSVQSIAKDLTKEIADHTKKANDKNSKQIAITLKAGPELQGLLTGVIGNGNAGYTQGTGGTPAPSSNPDGTIAVGSVAAP